jgi:hypothetical protein
MLEVRILPGEPNLCSFNQLRNTLFVFLSDCNTAFDVFEQRNAEALYKNPLFSRKRWLKIGRAFGSRPNAHRARRDSNETTWTVSRLDVYRDLVTFLKQRAPSGTWRALPFFRARGMYGSVLADGFG